jgi:tRNA A37 methylthiotransferase MiaB
MKSKILLVNPWYEYNPKKPNRYSRAWQPIDLATAAAIMENKDNTVKILDINALKIPLEKAIEQSEGFDKIFITSASLDRWQCPHIDNSSFMLTVKEFKKSFPKSEIYIMGPHPTMRPEKILQETKADGLIMGEPELAIVDLCEKSPKKTKGIAYLEKGKIKFTKKREPADISKFPIPAFHLLPMEKYSYEMMGDKFSIIETSRGCPFQCIFCAKDIMYNKKYRAKSLEKVEKELDVLVNNFGIKNIYFIDLEFTVNKNHSEEICDLLLRKNYPIKWTCQTRIDTVDEKLLKKMKKSGCKSIHFGIESGSDRILKLTKKGMNKDKIRKGIELTKKIGIETIGFFMLGLPEEREEDMIKTIEFAKELNPDYVSFNIASPYPGTEFYEIVKDQVKGDFPESYHGIYDQEFLKKMAKKGFIQFYLRPKYILSRILNNPMLLFKQFKLFLRFIG